MADKYKKHIGGNRIIATTWMRTGPGIWKSGKLGILKIRKMQFLKIQIRVAQNVGKVQTSRKNTSRPHYSPIVSWTGNIFEIDVFLLFWLVVQWAQFTWFGLLLLSGQCEHRRRVSYKISDSKWAHTNTGKSYMAQDLLGTHLEPSNLFKDAPDVKNIIPCPKSGTKSTLVACLINCLQRLNQSPKLLATVAESTTAVGYGWEQNRSAPEQL